MILPLIATFSRAETAGGRAIYVDAEGLITGDGATEETAVTFERLLDLSLTGGETIYLKKGDEYRGTLSLLGGTSGTPTTVTVYGTGANPVIKGTIASSSLTWTNNSGVWSAPCATRVNRIFKDGVAQRLSMSAEHPINSKPNSTTIMTTTGLGSWITDAEIVGKEYDFRWFFSEVSSYNSGTGELVLARGNGAESPFAFYILNHPNLITTAGDWAWVDGVVYYKSVSDPATLDVELSTIEVGIEIETGASFIEIDSIDCFGQALDGIYGDTVNNVTINNCVCSEQFGMGIALVRECSNINSTGCSLINNCNNGFISDELHYYNISFYTIEGTGMQTHPPFTREPTTNFGADSRYDVNVLSQGEGFATWSRGDNGSITNFTVSNTAYLGIHAEGKDLLIKYCEVSDYCKRQGDGGGIYTWGHEDFYGAFGIRTSQRVTIENCYVHDDNPVPTECGNVFGTMAAFYFDNGCEDNILRYNTVANIINQGFYQNNYNRNHLVHDNVFYNCGIGCKIDEGADGTSFSSTNNRYYDNIYVVMHSTQRSIQVLTGAIGGGGYIDDNIFISPYLTNHLKVNNTDSPLSSFSGYGTQDSYTASYVSEADAKAKMPVETNETASPITATVPSGFRLPETILSPPTLDQFESMVYID